MAYKITDGCIGCGACEGTCPVGAISNDGSVCVIDADTCIECGACAGACPTDSIKYALFGAYYVPYRYKKCHLYFM